jgi:putative transposase
MNRGKPAAAPIEMSSRIYALLVTESNKRTLKRHHLDRIRILLQASEQGGGQSNGQIKRNLAVSYNTVKVWRNRWTQIYPAVLAFEVGPTGKGVSDAVLVAKILSYLEDAPRPGTPPTFSLAQRQQIVALACQKPTDHGIEMTTWTHEMLAHVAMSLGIVATISSRYVGVLLKKATTPTA